MSRRPASTARQFVLAGTFLSVFFLMCSSPFAQDKAGPGDKIKELKEKRLVLLEKIHEFALKGYQQGDPKFTFDQVHQTKADLLAARLDLAEKKEDRIKICKEAVKNAEAWEESVRKRVNAGGESSIRSLQAQAYVLETRIALEKVLVVGPAGRTQERPAEQEQAVAALKKLGGKFTKVSVEVDEKSPGKPVIGVEIRSRGGPAITGKDLAPLKQLTSLRKLVLWDVAPVGDEALLHVMALTELRELTLVGVDVTDAGLVHLKQLTKLQVLEFFGNKGITDAGLKSLQPLTDLQKLGLGSAQVTNAGLAQLKTFTKLQELDLSSTNVSDAGLEHVSAMKTLRRLDLRETKVSDAGLARLKGLTDLQTLLLSPAITDAGLRHLEGLTKLRTLYLRDTQVTDAGLVHVKKFTNLESLDLFGKKITDAGLEHLKELTKLRSLNLGGTAVGDAGVAHLKGMTDLRELYLHGTKATDAGLAHLQGLTNLQTLYLSGTKVTNEGLVLVKSLNQLQVLELSGTEITDAGLVHLKGLTRLQRLGLSSLTNKVTDAGVDDLQKSLPKAKIEGRGKGEIN